MVLHTVIPQEAFDTPTEATSAVCARCPHGMVEGRREPDGGFVVTRMISTDPAAYLDPKYALGSVHREL